MIISRKQVVVDGRQKATIPQWQSLPRLASAYVPRGAIQEAKVPALVAVNRP
jgi:hypothetical protein